MYSSEYNADNGQKDIFYFISVFTCGIKRRYFHIACIEVVGCKYGNPPVDYENGRDDKSQAEKERKSEGEENYYSPTNQYQDLAQMGRNC